MHMQIASGSGRRGTSAWRRSIGRAAACVNLWREWRLFIACVEKMKGLSGISHLIEFIQNP